MSRRGEWTKTARVAALSSAFAALSLIQPLAAAAQPLTQTVPPQTPVATSLSKNTVSVAGEDRTYSYYVPANVSRSLFYAVIFALPDNGQTAEQFADQSGWIKLADQYGFAVVFPEPANGAWAINSGGESAYLKAVFEHARGHLLVTGAQPQMPEMRPPPGPPPPARPGAPPRVRRGGGPPRLLTWGPWYYLTGAGAGASAAEEFAIDNPGMFAAIATLNAAPYSAAYRHGEEPAQGYFQDMRAGINVPPSWVQLKKNVPVETWLFSSTVPTASLDKQVAYWRRADAASDSAAPKAIAGFQTEVFANADNEAQQVRVTKLPAAAVYDQALSAAIWTDLFSHVARWTSSPNGDIGPMLTKAEVEKTFDVKTIDPGDGRGAYTYYVKVPSTYRKGEHLPVVIALHGANYPAWAYLSQIKFHDLGEKEGFIAVYPNGRNQQWDLREPDGADPKFVQQLVADVIHDYDADPSRIYLQGFSHGSGETYLMGIAHPQLFAAVSPNNGIGPMTADTEAWVAALKAKSDLRVPMMMVSGNVDTGSSVDGLIPAEGDLQGAIKEMKAYDHITVADQTRTVDYGNTVPYDVLVPGAKVEHMAVDAHYPNGRFTVYAYDSADPKPLNLLDFVWVADLPHGADLREAKMDWDFFKHWRRNADGSLTYTP